MDLALELACTVVELEHCMTEREFLLWQMYSAKKMLPSRRMELHMAQQSLIIAKTMGNAKNVTLHDFMFERKNHAEVSDDIDSAIRGIGFGSHRLSQGRKLKKVN